LDAVNLKLAKAAEFLVMAEFALDGDCFDAAVSLAVSAGINAGDAACLQFLGVLPSGQDHGEAPRALQRAGHHQASSLLSRLLSVKSKAQYSVKRCTPVDADVAVKRADRMLRTVRASIPGATGE